MNYKIQKEIDYKELGESIKKVRKEKGLTQEQLAEMIDCSKNHVSNIENNYTKPSLDTFFRIANALDTSMDSIVLEQYNDPAAVQVSNLVKTIQNLSDVGIELAESFINNLNNYEKSKNIK